MNTNTVYPTSDCVGGDLPPAPSKPTECAYCGKPMEAPVTHKIIDRGWDNVLRRQFVRTREMQFCSDQCGSNYQMGCEG